MNYGDLKARVFEQLSTPISEKRQQAGTAINSALVWAQRMRDFNVLRSLVNITYPADEPAVDWIDLTEKQAKRLRNVQLTTECAPYGRELIIRTRDYVLRNRRLADQPGWAAFPTNRHGHGVRGSSSDCSVFLSGRLFGLYPVPTEDLDLEIEFVEWLPLLEDDEDTNILLEHGWDFFLYKATEIVRSTYPKLKEEDDGLMKEMLRTAWESVVAWDASMQNVPIDI